MKKLLSTICAAVIAASAVVLPVHADKTGTYEDAGGNIYKYHINSFGASIEKIEVRTAAGELIIPAEIEGEKVYMLSDFAFDKSDRDKVQKIRLEADTDRFRFEAMENLTEITLPDGLKKIPEIAFIGCTSLKSITIPESVTEIGSQAFKSCTSLKSIVVPDSVKTLGDMAFMDCSSLADITWNRNADIGLSVFSGTKYLADYDGDFILINNGKTLYASAGKNTVVQIPETVTDITQFAFDGSPVRKVIYPASMKTIPQNAFCGAAKLEEIEFRGTITEMGMNAFQNCTSLRTAVIPEGVTRIPFGSFAGCTGIDEIVIPDAVTGIESEAFENCKSVKSITLSKNCSVIPEMCFAYCESLTGITVPENVKRIETRAFADCFALSDVKMSDSTEIGEDAFKNTPYAKAMQLPRSTDEPDRKTQTDDASSHTSQQGVTQAPAPAATPITAPAAVATEEPERSAKIDVIYGDKLSIELNDKSVEFPDAKPYIDDNGRTQIPIRAVAEALGCKVDWDDTSRTATIIKDKTVIIIVIGSSDMQVGSETVQMDTAAEIKDERTYIPVRFVGEALGMTVNWADQ